MASAAFGERSGKSALPYKLEFDSELVSLEKFSSIEVRAFGQLEGRGRWTFTAIDSGRTRIDFPSFNLKKGGKLNPAIPNHILRILQLNHK